MDETDLMLLEKYLVEYRSRAYDAYHSNLHDTDCQDDDDAQPPVIIGTHSFLPLTTKTCARPYIDLPDTLSGKDRRKIHSICASIDLFHAGVGIVDSVAPAETNDSSSPSPNRKLIVSIFADAMEFLPKQMRNSAASQSFPSRSCRTWYYRAHNSILDGNDDCPYKQRRATIELEKKQIHQFAKLPEQSLRTSDGVGESDCDRLDFSVLSSLDLSKVPSVEVTPWELVDTVEKLKTCVDELVYGIDDSTRSPRIHDLAFDMEMSTVGEGRTGKSGVRTCLLQLTSDAVNKDYVIDPLAPGVWDALPTYLGPLFSDPKIVKIGQGIGGMDCSSLHRDFGILVVNAFDTHEASCVLAGSTNGGMGLAALCRHYGLPRWEHYKELKRKYQASDWRRRPLDDDALEYGRYDIRFLITLRKLLMRDLVKMDLLGSKSSTSFSSVGDESSIDPVSTVGADNGLQMHSFYSRIDSGTNSATASFSESDFNDTATSSDADGLPEDVNNGGDSTEKLVISASEFPCYHSLMKAISTSNRRCLKLWAGDDNEPVLQNPSLLSVIKQAAKGTGNEWSNANMQLYRSLAKWRADVARKEYLSMAEVCSLDFLVHVAYKLPRSQCELRRYSYVLPPLIEDETHCKDLVDLVASSDAFQHRRDLCSDVVYYRRGDVNGVEAKQKQGRLQNVAIKLLVASAAIGSVVFVLARAKKR